MKMRPREWDALALLSSSDDSFLERRNRTGEPGSSFGICDCIRHYIRDASPRPFRTQLEAAIPDPGDRLLRHAENSRGGMPIFSIEPGIDDQKWADWQSRWADEQDSEISLLHLAGIGDGPRHE